ncbi:hypothetical protein HYH02_008933 [Chlamydomonas schloesseri]|uniref:26S proteasome non-ATPase regulatory subunit 5 n=1 Tax=Chlamydomonas schloesseri TaxID=2026947 RepID=A0A835WD23_9CHLO|nr:hypothetical protein HYH02_008933 [Chlamydomonas schloesseri]|eukprot:KAG2445066.1 hypothetical protein HYH02_008933 [Chlamydomonas schloesseri]
MAPVADSCSEDLENLLELCKELDTQPPPLRDSHANAFFSSFPLERLFRALASARDKDAVGLVSEVLGRLLGTELGRTLLPGAAPYLAAAAEAPLPALRRLAAEQYGSLLAHSRSRTAAAAGTDGNVEDEVASTSLSQLVHILTDDPDTTVAAAAAASIRAYVSAGGLPALQRVLGAGSPAAAALVAAAERDRGGTVRLRVLALALELAAAGDGAAGSSNRLSNGVPESNGSITNGDGPSTSGSSSSADERLQLLRGSGLLQPLLRTLSEGAADPLACLASLQLLEELMAASDPESDPGAIGSSGRGYRSGGASEGVAVALAGLALPQLLQLLSDPMLSDAAMPLVAGIVRRSLPEALPPATAAAVAAAAAAAAATAAGYGNGLPADPMQVDSGGAASASPVTVVEGPALRAAPALLAAVRGVLDDAGDASPAAEACGLDAVGRLGQSRAGAQLVLADGAVARSLCERALGRSPHPEVRMAALHALAATAGLERAGADRARAAAVLPAQYEETLRRCVFEACGGPAVGGASLKRPGEVVLGLLAQPFVELRLAAYRCLAAMALRSWFAVEVITTPDLAARLLDAGSESGAAACNWRHAAASALWAAVSAAARGEVAGAGEEAFAATLAAPGVLERVRQAVRAGPYGTDGGGAAGAAAAAEAARRMHEQHSVATRGGGGGGGGA